MGPISTTCRSLPDTRKLILLTEGGSNAPRFFQTPSHRSAMPEPKEVNATLLRLGGVTLEGRPRYRCVWGSSRTEWLFSRKRLSYEKRLKHFRHANRWVIEFWNPPSYDRESWEKETTEYIDGHRVELLGPYPSTGDYEYLWHAETPHSPECEISVPVKGGDGGCICGGGNYLPIETSMAEALMAMVEATKRLHRAEKKNKLIATEEKKQADYEKIVDDAVDDAGRPFGGSYFVPVTGKSPDHWPKDPKHRFNPS